MNENKPNCEYYSMCIQNTILGTRHKTIKDLNYIQ